MSPRCFLLLNHATVNCFTRISFGLPAIDYKACTLLLVQDGLQPGCKEPLLQRNELSKTLRHLEGVSVVRKRRRSRDGVEGRFHGETSTIAPQLLWRLGCSADLLTLYLPGVSCRKTHSTPFYRPTLREFLFEFSQHAFVEVSWSHVRMFWGNMRRDRTSGVSIAHSARQRSTTV